MEWTRDNTLELVKLLEVRPVLWNTKLQSYRNKDLKRSALEDISTKMEISKEEVERRIHNLKVQFSREFCRVMKSKKSVADEDDEEIYDPKWYAYKPLMFLREGTNRQSSLASTTATLIDPDDDDETRLYQDNTNTKYKPDTSSPQNLQCENSPSTSPIPEYKPELEIPNRPPRDSQYNRPIPMVQIHTSSTENNNTTNNLMARKRRYRSDIENAFDVVKRVMKGDPHDDEFGLFGQYIAQKLRNFNNRFFQAKIKQEIQEVIYKNELLQLSQEANPTPCNTSLINNYYRAADTSQEVTEIAQNTKPNRNRKV